MHGCACYLLYASLLSGCIVLVQFFPCLLLLLCVSIVPPSVAMFIQNLQPPTQPLDQVALHQELWYVLETLLKMNMGGVRRVRLVVNSRMALGGGLGGADQVYLSALHAAAAQELLQMHAGQEVVWEEGQAMQLAQICVGNALALTLVGGLLAARRCSPKVHLCAWPHTSPHMHGMHQPGAVPRNLRAGGCYLQCSFQRRVECCR
jgi:hypothetical protein